MPVWLLYINRRVDDEDARTIIHKYIKYYLISHFTIQNIDVKDSWYCVYLFVYVCVANIS